MSARSMAKDNSGLRQLRPRSEPARNMVAPPLRVARDQLGRGLLRRRDELRVALEVGEAEQRIAALALAQDFAGPAQLEVAVRDLESVARFVDHLEARARRLGERAAVEQDAGAVARISSGGAADAPAQLVELREAEALRALDHHQRCVG